MLVAVVVVFVYLQLTRWPARPMPDNMCYRRRADPRPQEPEAQTSVIPAISAML